MNRFLPPRGIEPQTEEQDRPKAEGRRNCQTLSHAGVAESAEESAGGGPGRLSLHQCHTMPYISGEKATRFALGGHFGVHFHSGKAFPTRTVRARAPKARIGDSRGLVMNKDRGRKGRPSGPVADILAGRFEYDRADEKRKIQEEIEDFLEERQDKGASSRS
jgi:hypothetical protein